MESVQHFVQTVFGVLLDGLMFLRLCLRPSAAVAAENLFLRKQLGLFVERQVKPRRATDSIRFTLRQLSRWFDWREASHCRPTGNLDPMAPQRLPSILEMEIAAPRPAFSARRGSKADPRDGPE